MTEAQSKLPMASDKPAPAAQTPSIWQPLESLRGEIDRVFDDFARGFGRPLFGRGFFDLEPFRRFDRQLAVNAPAVDLVEKEDRYLVTAELPGIDEKDVDVKIADNILTIKGEKKEEREEREKGRYLSERRYGAFTRSFQLPTGVDEAKIEATFEKGVLTVTLPKTAEAKAKEKKIAIKAK